MLRRTEGKCPVGFPKAFEVTYCHVDYRLYVTAEMAEGEHLDGLYFLRRDADFRARTTSSNILWTGYYSESTSESARFHRYRPLGLSVHGDRIHRAEVLREESDWRERPLCVREDRWAFFDHLHQHDARLEWASLVSPIDYRWRLGEKTPLSTFTPPPVHVQPL